MNVSYIGQLILLLLVGLRMKMNNRMFAVVVCPNTGLNQSTNQNDYYIVRLRHQQVLRCSRYTTSRHVPKAISVFKAKYEPQSANAHVFGSPARLGDTVVSNNMVRERKIRVW